MFNGFECLNKNFTLSNKDWGRYKQGHWYKKKIEKIEQIFFYNHVINDWGKLKKDTIVKLKSFKSKYV